MKNLKEIFLQKKIEKRKKLAHDFFIDQGGADNIFLNFKHKPSVQQFEEMVVSSNYGIQDCLSRGGDLFRLEYLLDEVKIIYKQKFKNQVDTIEDQSFFIGFGRSCSEYWANLFSLFYVDNLFLDFIMDFDVDDFEINENNGERYYIDKETKSIIVYPAYEFFTDLKYFFKEIEYEYEPVFVNSQIKNNKCLTAYRTLITTQDNFFDLKNKVEKEREKHKVNLHLRHLNSGKIVLVKEHVRGNPIRIKKDRFNTSEIDYIVYHVRDKDGLIRYFGEGKTDRPKHVNSGVSHNFKINEHFFLRGSMSVEIIKENLSKQEALALESLFIKSYRENQLWNIKEYEPIFESD